MQTFLPYSSFSESASCLDYRRLGKQRVETWQILQVLDGKTKAWSSHPAVKMWRGHRMVLCSYGIECCKNWISRGYKDNMLSRFEELLYSYYNNNLRVCFPFWWGNQNFHSSHRAALLFKNFAHYSQFNWTEKPELNYFWPN